MFEFLLAVLAAVDVFFRSRGDASLEVLALRQQVAQSLLLDHPPAAVAAMPFDSGALDRKRFVSILQRQVEGT
jgi:hypothetical protein